MGTKIRKQIIAGLTQRTERLYNPVSQLRVLTVLLQEELEHFKRIKIGKIIELTNGGYVKVIDKIPEGAITEFNGCPDLVRLVLLNEQGEETIRYAKPPRPEERGDSKHPWFVLDYPGHYQLGQHVKIEGIECRVKDFLQESPENVRRAIYLEPV